MLIRTLLLSNRSLCVCLMMLLPQWTTLEKPSILNRPLFSLSSSKVHSSLSLRLNSVVELDKIACSVRCYEKGKYVDFHVGTKDTVLYVVSRDIPVDIDHHVRLLYNAISMAFAALNRIGLSD